MAVLAGEADLGAVEELEAARVRPVAKAEQDPGRDAALDELAAPDRKRRDPDPAADEDRARRVGASSLGAENGRPSGPVSQSPSPASSVGQPLGPGPTPSTRKSSRTPSPSGSPSATEKARGRKGRSSSPAPAAQPPASM